MTCRNVHNTSGLSIAVMLLLSGEASAGMHMPPPYIVLKAREIAALIKSSDLIEHQAGAEDVRTVFEGDGAVHRFNHRIDQGGAYRLYQDKLCMSFVRRSEKCYHVQQRGISYSMREAELPSSWQGVWITFEKKK